MATLGDLAKLVRSKNAGPFWLTIDIMFDEAEAYRRARDAEIVNRAAIARLYNRNPAGSGAVTSSGCKSMTSVPAAGYVIERRRKPADRFSSKLPSIPQQRLEYARIVHGWV